MGRRGFSVLELLVALVCFCLLTALSLQAVAGAARGMTRLQERSSWLHAARTSRWVLASELGAGAAGVDWTVQGTDRVHARAFRGVGLVCGRADGASWRVRVRGDREADPDKDSVLVLDVDGRWSAGRLVGTAGDSLSCGDPSAGTGRVWRVEGEVGEAVLMRLFESGTYLVAGGALRYRRGAGGAQPLTEAVLHDTRFVASEVGITLETAAPAGRPWRLPLGRRP